MHRLFLLILVITSCKSDDQLGNLSGDAQSIQLVTEMIETLGGAEKWRNLNTISISKLVKEGNRSYEAQEIFNLSSSSMYLEHKLSGGTISRKLKQDTAWVINDNQEVLLDETNTKFLKYWLELNLYNKLHQLVTDSLFVRFTEQNHLMVMSTNRKEYKFGFSLSKEFTPTIFYRPKFNEQDISLKLSDWRDVEGYLIPFKGESVEGDYSFQVDEVIINE